MPAPATSLHTRRRWLNVALAALFINTSYGALSYSFSVLVTRSAAGGSLGTGTVALGFSLALLVSGVAAVGAGVVADLFGSRRMMAAGAVLGAVGLALLAACREPWQAILVFTLLLGPAMAATFYEPVYVLMNRWFEAPDRPRAYGVLTLLSGVSITIFTPLTQLLVEALGWRGAVLSLAAILVVVGALVPAFLTEPAEREPRAASAGAFVRDLVAGVRYTTPAFWVFSAAFFAATAAFSGFSFHMIAQLQTRGFDEGGVARAIAITGLVSLPARFALPFISARAGSATLLAVCLALLAVSAAIASGADQWWQVWVYVGVFGTVFGAVYPLRALVASEQFAGPFFGRIIGLQALTVALGRAAGPAAIALIGTDRAAYGTGFRVAAAVLVVSAVVAWLSMRRRTVRPGTR